MIPEVLSYVCPFCDREVRVGDSCRGCEEKARKRKRKKRSWEQPKSQDGLGLPDEDFDYDETIRREFGKSPHQALGLKWYWWLLGVAVLVGMAVSAFWLR